MIFHYPPIKPTEATQLLNLPRQPNEATQLLNLIERSEIRPTE